MRSNILPAALIAAMTLAGSAFAGTTAATTTAPATAAAATTMAAKAPATPAGLSGTIGSINTKLLYVVINGWKYHLPKGFDLTSFKVGEKVLVTYTMSGKKHEVSSMKAAV